MSAKPSTSAWAGDLSDEFDEADTSKLLESKTDTYGAIRQHEEGLNKLGEAVKRQKYVANEIATEVDLHNEILDDIDAGITNTNENIQKATRNVKLVLKKSSTCCLWFIIFILALVILALAII